MSGHPPSWIEVSLGDITADCTQRIPGPDESFQYIDIASIDRETKRIVSPQTLTGSSAPGRARKVVRAGDVLVSMTRPNLNAVALVPRELDAQIASTGLDVLRPMAIEPRWVFYVVRTKAFVDSMSALVQGALYPAVRSKDVRGFQAVLAPLAEQKRIADKLDALLARVDACRGRLDRVTSILKHFRQSVLAAATGGELTREWREERGRDLADWETTTIAALLDGKPRNGYSPRAVERPTAVRSLTLTATTTGTFRGEHSKYIDEEIPPESHLWLVPGDILIQRANTIEHVGVSAIFDGPSATFIYPDLMMKCRANARVVTPFLHYILSSEPVRTFFRESATGTAGNMPKINQQAVLAAPAVLPPLDEQLEVVRRMKALLAFADQLDRRYDMSRKLVGKFTPAALAKAFRGELVSQDPNDEPASKLLARLLLRGASMEDADKIGRSKRGSRTKAKVGTNMLTRKDVTRAHLTTILRERGALSAEALWSASELTIDDFYDQLKDEEARGLLREKRGAASNAPRLLEPAA